jgi:CRP/FNR family transcriptional regulator, cyclic AMP receptor protein
MTEKIDEALRESALFGHLGEDDLTALKHGASLQVHPQGHKIIREGSRVDCLYLILSGRVRVWTQGPSGIVELKSLGPGACFGEVSVLGAGAATATVEVQTGPAQLVTIARDRLIALLARDETTRSTLEGMTIARAKDTLGKVLK